MFEVLELIQKAVLLGCLFLCAWIDHKKQEVYPFLLGIAAIIGILLHLFTQNHTWEELLLGMLPGGILWIVAWATKEGIGFGDALVFILSGIYLGFWENLNLMFWSFILTGIMAAFFIIIKKKGRKERMPMLPCVFAAYAFRLL